MQAREYAERLRRQGHSYATVRVLVSLVYKPVSYETVRNWLSPKRRESQQRYMREWQRQYRKALKAGKKPGKPITDRQKFQDRGPFQ